MKKAAFLSLFILINTFVWSQTFTPTGMGGGGYMYSPSISPFNHNNAFLVCDMGGVYRTTNGGTNWTMQHYNQLVSTVKGKVQYTSDPNILYAVRKSLTNQQDPLLRGEPVKSTDGGVTWQKMTDPTSSGVHVLLADPLSTQRILLNEYNQLFFSNNGGASFTSVYHPNNDQMWLGGAFWDGNNIYVGTDKGLLVSHDGGQSFGIEPHTGLPANTGIFQLTGAKQNGVTRLFAVLADASQLYAWVDVLGLQSYLKGIFKLDYTINAAWQNIQGNIPATARLKWMDLATNNVNTVYAAGDINDEAYIYKSTNGGTSWTNTFLINNNQNIATGWAGAGGAYSYQASGGGFGFDVANDDPNVVMMTNAFAYTTTNGGTSWRQMHVTNETQNAQNTLSSPTKYYKSSGLDVTTGNQLHWLSQSELFSCNADIGNNYSQDGGNTWTLARNTFETWGAVSNNNWYRLVQHPTNGTLYAAVADVNDMYMAGRINDDNIDWAGGKVLTSTNKGVSWTTLYNFGHPVAWLTIDPTNPLRMYASVVHHTEGGIFRTTNGGVSWTKLNLPARTEGHPYNIQLLNNNALVVTFAARALSDGQTLTASSGVFYSTDGGNTWLDRTDSRMQYFTKDFIIDPADASQNTWYASVWGRFTVFAAPNNAGNGGIYKTTNRGQTWTRIFTHELAESMTIDPLNANTMYVPTEWGGLYQTTNLQSTAPTFSKVASYPFSRPKRVFVNPFNKSEMWVTTMGGALWKTMTTVVPVQQTTYYVSPIGNDNNTGTINAPFKTWQRGHDATKAGDTVWIRGGVYPLVTANQKGVNMVGHNGEPNKRINFWAYPGETPILDCSGMTGAVSLRGVWFEENYWHFKGLEIKGVPMKNATNNYPDGFWGQNCSNNIFENLNIHHNEGIGFALYEGSSNNLVLNSDFHHNYDPKTSGGNSDGASFRYLLTTSTGNIMRNCRAWSNSDDGFDFWEANAPITVENCWSFRNGFVPNTTTAAGNGVGFKMGQNTTGQHIVRNNISFNNRAQGFDDNLSGSPQLWNNNTSYNNGAQSYRVVGTGAHILRNNIAVPNDAAIPARINQTYNSWTLPVTANAADFLSADPTGTDGARQANGSLPNLSFLKLATSSDLINVGTNVGLPYTGNAPDLGAFESSVINQSCSPPNSPPIFNNITTTSAAVYWNTDPSAVNGYKVEYKKSTDATWLSVNTTAANVILNSLMPTTTYNVRISSLCSTTTTSVPTGISSFTTISACLDIYEPNNSFSTAKVMTTPNTIRATISTATDQDFFKFTTVSGQTNIGILLTNLPTNLNLTLLSNNNTVLATSANTGTLNEVIFYNNTVPTTYTVQIIGASGAFSYDCYALTVISSSTPFNVTPTALTQLAEKAPMDEHLSIINQLAKPQVSATLGLSPNPTRNSVTLTLNTDKAGDYAIAIVNAFGQTIKEEKVHFTEGYNAVPFDTSQLPSGMYIVRFGQNSLFTSHKLVIER